MKTLARVYDNVDMLMLKTLLEYEGCLDALHQGSSVWGLDARKARNLLYHPAGDLDWIHSLTVPLWNEVISHSGTEWSEEALRHVAKILLFKGSLIELEVPQLLAGVKLVFTGAGSINDNFPSAEMLG